MNIIVLYIEILYRYLCKLSNKILDICIFILHLQK